MAAPHLTAIPNQAQPEPCNDAELINLGRAETGAQRLRRLQAEARLLAREQAEELIRDLSILADRAAEIAEGGEAFPVGVRELASRIAADLPEKGKAMTMIIDRTGRN
jgi:hypothetical protein